MIQKTVLPGARRLALRNVARRALRAVDPSMRVDGVPVQWVHGRLKAISSNADKKRRAPVISLADRKRKHDKQT